MINYPDWLRHGTFGPPGSVVGKGKNGIPYAKNAECILKESLLLTCFNTGMTCLEASVVCYIWHTIDLLDS